MLAVGGCQSVSFELRPALPSLCTTCMVAAQKALLVNDSKRGFMMDGLKEEYCLTLILLWGIIASYNGFNTSACPSLLFCHNVAQYGV